MNEQLFTASQYKTYQFICQYVDDNGVAPTEAEIAAGIGIKSRGVAHRYVKALAAKGVLHLVPNRRRNIQIIKPLNTSDLEIIGTIAAGSPIEAINTQENVDMQQFIGPDRYALRVKGDSMIDEGIFDDDVIICERKDTAREGDIVVALIDREEATLKRLQNNGNGTITLVPANKELEPLTYDAARVTIQGIFKGLLRLVR